MSSTSRVLTRIKEQTADNTSFEDGDIMNDERYLRKSSTLINDALQKGYDIMQMPNGDVLITEVKTITFQYQWDEKKGKFERAKSGSRTKKRRKSESDNPANFNETEDEKELIDA